MYRGWQDISKILSGKQRGAAVCVVIASLNNEALQRSIRAEKNLEKSNYNNNGIAVLAGADHLAIFEKTKKPIDNSFNKINSFFFGKGI